MKNPIFKRAPPKKTPVLPIEAGGAILHTPVIRNALIIIALACIIFFLRYAKDFLIPMAMALVFAAVLDPVTRRLRAIGVPTSIAAGLTVLIALFAMGGSIYLVSDEVAAAVEKLPALSQGLKDRAKSDQATTPSTVTKLSETAKNLEEAASTLSGAPPSAKPAPRTEVRTETRPSWLRAQLASGSTTVVQVVGQILLALLITHFILASGPMLRRKLLRASGNHRNHRALMRRILSQSCAQVQMYVVIMLATNVAVGLAVWPVFHWLGFEQHGLWALFAAVAHIVPYVGSVLVAAAAALVTYLGSPDILDAVNAGLIVLVVVSMVATLLSTWLQSRTSRMNQVVVFVGIMFWGWLWGLWGLFLGAPIVVIVKVICDNISSLRGAARLLGD